MSLLQSKPALRELIRAVQSKTRPLAAVAGKYQDRLVVYQGDSYYAGRVRLTLRELQYGYQNQVLVLAAKSENQVEEYMQLRMLGMDEKDASPTTIPTLVDLQTQQVICESDDQVEYLINMADGKLKPTEFADYINQHCTFINSVELPSLITSGDNRPFFVKKGLPLGKSMRKTQKLSLAKEYEAKGLDRVAELVKWDTEKMAKLQEPEVALQYVREGFDKLEGDLKNSGNRHLCGDMITKADLYYMCLFRMLKWMGNEYLWEQEARPKLRGYVHRLFDRPSFGECLVATPLAGMPSPYTIDLHRKYEGNMKAALLQQQVYAMNIGFGAVSMVKKP